MLRGEEGMYCGWKRGDRESCGSTELKIKGKGKDKEVKAREIMQQMESATKEER